MQHAFVIGAEAEKGIEVAQTWAREELGMALEHNPDIAVLRYGLFSVADARKVAETVAGAPFKGETKVVIIAAHRAYHEAQNALLKVFEEPPEGTYLFLILPTLGGLLPTLRSRVQVLKQKMSDTECLTAGVKHSVSDIPEVAQEFMNAGKEKRIALIKKLASGKDEEERREHREEAIALLDGIEAAAYESFKRGGETATRLRGGEIAKLLSDISVLRGHLYDRSAPVRMILEHISLVIPKELGK